MWSRENIYDQNRSPNISEHGFLQVFLCVLLSYPLEVCFLAEIFYLKTMKFSGIEMVSRHLSSESVKPCCHVPSYD